MQHRITTSADGSSTLQLTRFNEAYHSTNGAYTEAMHIYIRCGVEHLLQKLLEAPLQGAGNTPPHIRIFDIGFGTALNCILTYTWQQQLRQKGLPHPRITYYGIEKYPIQPGEAKQLNYTSIIAQHANPNPDNLSETFTIMHTCPWEEDIILPPASGSVLQEKGGAIGPSGISGKDTYAAPEFILHKSCADIARLQAEFYREAGNHAAPAVVYYDTFSPATQPELWDEAIFRTIAAGCPTGSLLVTYCSKGAVKQALRNSGFTLERLPGPPGKRHILRGTL